MPNVRLQHTVSTSHHRFDVLSGMLGHQKQHNMIAKSLHMQQKAEDRAAALADTEVFTLLLARGFELLIRRI